MANSETHALWTEQLITNANMSLQFIVKSRVLIMLKSFAVTLDFQIVFK